MKKTLIASAVALATLATAGVHAAEVKLPKVYGNIQLILEQGNTETSFSDTTGNDSFYEHGDTGSTIGFSHEHEIMPGLTGFAKAEFEFNADEQKGSGKGLNKGDQAFLGLKGDFGSVKLGSYDTIYDDAIDDTVADVFEELAAFTTKVTGEGDTLTYYTPKMSGFSAAVALQINGENDESYVSKKDATTTADDVSKNTAMAVLGYEINDTKINLGWDGADNSARHSTYGLAVTHGMGDLGLGFSYQTQEDNFDVFSLRGSYEAGANQFILSYQFVDYDEKVSNDEANQVSFQALHNLSSNMYLYVEGQWTDIGVKSSKKTASDAASPVGDVEATRLILGATYVF